MIALTREEAQQILYALQHTHTSSKQNPEQFENEIEAMELIETKLKEKNT